LFHAITLFRLRLLSLLLDYAMPPWRHAAMRTRRLLMLMLLIFSAAMPPRHTPAKIYFL